MSSKRLFSIVVPFYCNAPNIPHTIPRLLSLREKLPKYALEYVFVDDGSLDNTIQLLIDARKEQKEIKVVKLSRNFGSMSAIQAGLKYARGDCVGMITADLQDPPEIFLEMIEKWEDGNKVVIAVRKQRKDPIIKRFFSNLYYKCLNAFAMRGYPKGGFDCFLLDRQVVHELRLIPEKNTNVMSLIYWLGHNRYSISYVRQKRLYGKSKWTFSKKLKFFIDTFVNFSFAPIRFISITGTVVAILSFLYGTFVIVMTFFGKIPVQGWTTLIALITFLLGLIMIMLGIIGEYLWRVLDESRKRPGYVIDEVYSDESEK